MKRLCVYCGSSAGTKSSYQAGAIELAKRMVQHDIELVYGGASVGLMGIIAGEVLRLGGRVVGVMPKALVEKEIAHPHLSELIQVSSMHARKAKMEELSDGFIAMPGGLGTLDEMFEILTWAQLGYHQKPCAFFNIAGYYDQLMVFIDHIVEQGFCKPVYREMILLSSSADDILQIMKHYKTPSIYKWIEHDSL